MYLVIILNLICLVDYFSSILATITLGKIKFNLRLCMDQVRLLIGEKRKKCCFLDCLDAIWPYEFYCYGWM